MRAPWHGPCSTASATAALLQELLLALRRLRRSPTFTAAPAATLALGIGANVASFSVVHAVLLRPLPLRDDARLVRLFSVGRQGSGPTSPPDLMDLREQTRAFEGPASVAPAAVTLGADRLESSPMKVQTAMVTAGFFQVLGPRVQLGRALQTGDDAPGAPQVAVLSHALRQRRFGGGPDALGRTVNLGGPLPWTGVGVMAPGLDFPSRAELWTPVVQDASMTKPEARGAHWLEVCRRLEPGVSLGQAKADAAAVARSLAARHPATSADMGASVVPLRDVLLGQVRPSLLLLLGAGGWCCSSRAPISCTCCWRGPRTTPRTCRRRTSPGTSRQPPGPEGPFPRHAPQPP